LRKDGIGVEVASQLSF